jgi:hypothetical protein
VKSRYQGAALQEAVTYARADEIVICRDSSRRLDVSEISVEFSVVILLLEGLCKNNVAAFPSGARKTKALNPKR